MARARHPSLQGLVRLGERLARLKARAPQSIAAAERLEPMVSDLQFTRAYQVPFQYASYIGQHIRIRRVATASSGVFVEDLDGNRYYDLTGSYGVPRARNHAWRKGDPGASGPAKSCSVRLEVGDFAGNQPQTSRR